MEHKEHRALLFSTHSPFIYCEPDGKHINLSNPDSQCTSNRAGILCSGCKINYSLTIGSSRCIHCPNSNNLALLIFFGVAGVLVVLVIAGLNLTVTQGMINGLIFYANIIWAYQNILPLSDFGRIGCSQNLHCLAQFRLWNWNMLLSRYECLLKSMVTVHIPLLYCWSLPSRATLFFKIIYAFWKSISFHPRYIVTFVVFKTFTHYNCMSSIGDTLHLSWFRHWWIYQCCMGNRWKLLIWSVSTHLPPISCHSLFHFTVDCLIHFSYSQCSGWGV